MGPAGIGAASSRRARATDGADTRPERRTEGLGRRAATDDGRGMGVRRVPLGDLLRDCGIAVFAGRILHSCENPIGGAEGFDAAV